MGDLLVSVSLEGGSGRIEEKSCEGMEMFFFSLMIYLESHWQKEDFNIKNFY